MEIGLVHKINIDDEMQQAYLDYAMSVIVARALPDARDGLKPVHRRILYAMHDMGLHPDSPYKKSARIVGEVLGKYHPHGDMAVYDAMARMAQDFSMRYPLVDGQGNFGSMDGDSPAAMRYTEARTAEASTHLLKDIDKNTVDFIDNFDGTLKEPTVLPSSIPNLLINGATGIAVGMATSIPTHNLNEVIDALQFMLLHWEKLDDISVEDLMRYVQGPDFPTGGVIIQDATGDGLISAYSTGRGRITVQARAHLEELERGKNRIIVTELPYMTNKSSLIERIAELAREEKLEGIVDLRDESDRHGMRIVIDLSKTVDPEIVLQNLYKHTPMQTTFSIIMLALVAGEPRLLSLKQALKVFIEHRLEIVRRRSEFELEKARARAHILEGLLIALGKLDEVISLIRHAPDVDTARARLIRRFRLSEVQAQSILEMQLRRLAALEQKKIEQEYIEIKETIKKLEVLLKSPRKIRQVIGEELQSIKDQHGDRRKTHIVRIQKGIARQTLLTTADLIPEKTIWISATIDGLITRTTDDKPPCLIGKEAPASMVLANTRDVLYLVCEKGEAAAVPVHSLPEADSPLAGTPYFKVSALSQTSKLATMFVLPQKHSSNSSALTYEGWYVLTATKQGYVKKTALSELPGASANVFTLAKVNEGDHLGWLRLSNGQNEILLMTAKGMAIRFDENEVRPMGLIAAGVMGIKLAPNDEIIGMELLPHPGEVFMIASDGSAKRVNTAQFPKQGRYGQGITAWRLPAKVQVVGITVDTGTTRAILHMGKLLPKPIRLDEAPLQGRSARGKIIQPIKAGDQIYLLTVPWEIPRPTAQKRTTSRRGRASGTTPTTQSKS